MVKVIEKIVFDNQNGTSTSGMDDDDEFLEHDGTTIYNHNNIEHLIEYYKRKQNGRKMFIFNHETFETENKRPRKGTKMDVKMLVECFGRLKFNVFVYNDLKKVEIFDLLHKVCEMGEDSVECVAVVILSYGQEDHLYAYDMKYHENDLFNIFSKKLKGIPKLFFIQSGRERSTGLIPLPDEDMLVVYSTKSGYCSYRNVDQGGWFIKSLTTQLDRLEKHSNLILELQHVTCMVERNFAAKNNKEQSPEYKSTLTKTFLIGPE